MSLLAYAIAAIVVMGMIGTGVYKVKQWGAGEVRAEWATPSKLQREREELQISESVKEFEEMRAARSGYFKKVVTYVNVEIEKPVYRNICLPASGLCIANAAILGQSADTCNADAPMPAAVPAKRWDRGDDPALGDRCLGILQRLRSKAPGASRGYAVATAP